MAKSFDIWVKDGAQYVCIDDESKYIEYLNNLMRNYDLIDEQLVVNFYLRDIVGS